MLRIAFKGDVIVSIVGELSDFVFIRHAQLLNICERYCHLTCYIFVPCLSQCRKISSQWIEPFVVLMSNNIIFGGGIDNISSKLFVKCCSVVGLVHRASHIIFRTQSIDCLHIFPSKRKVKALQVALNSVSSQTLGKHHVSMSNIPVQ